MSDRDKKVLLAVGMIILFVLMICFIRPVLIAEFEAYMEAEEGEQSGTGVWLEEAEQSGTGVWREEAEPSETREELEETESSKNVQQAGSESTGPDKTGVNVSEYRFRSRKLLSDHYEKHGIDMGFQSAEEYEKAASAVVLNPDALHKTEAEDGDDVYYIEATNEFVIVSKDGYIRTYFKPDSGIRYYNKQ